MKKIILGLTAVTLAVSLSACDPTSKASQPFQDADVSGNNTAPAAVLTMPDGFSNAATKCDHGNRVYVLYHGDSPYGDIAVVPGDPSCAGK